MSLAAILDNQVFAGVAGAAIVSAALYQLRALPPQAWAIVKDQFSATLTVYSEQDAFRQIDLWLARHPSAKRSRRLAVTERWNQAAQITEFEATPGPGPHLLWEAGRPVFVRRDVETNPSAMGGPMQRRQTVTLTTIGRDRGVLLRMMAEAQTVQDRDVVPIYMWQRDRYELVERRTKRALESVVLADGLRDAIVADATRFLSRRDWYMDKGVPHRRGYLFEGPPGTGKSSMALALAGALRRAVYIINPAAVDDDNALQAAVNQGGGGVVLIEDIDSVDSGRERRAGGGADAVKTGISTSGLLNAIDGVAARDGRILIITSNHADQLDKALIRPGRVDLRCHFGPAGLTEAVAMFRRFCPGGDELAFAREVGPALPLPQAELQNLLLARAA